MVVVVVVVHAFDHSMLEIEVDLLSLREARVTQRTLLSQKTK